MELWPEEEVASPNNYQLFNPIQFLSSFLPPSFPSLPPFLPSLLLPSLSPSLLSYPFFHHFFLLSNQAVLSDKAFLGFSPFHTQAHTPSGIQNWVPPQTWYLAQLGDRAGSVVPTPPGCWVLKTTTTENVGGSPALPHQYTFTLGILQENYLFYCYSSSKATGNMHPSTGQPPSQPFALRTEQAQKVANSRGSVCQQLMRRGEIAELSGLGWTRGQRSPVYP